MTTYVRRAITTPALPHLRRHMFGRGTHIRGITIHSSRSGVRDGDDGPRTENWMSNPANRVVDRAGNVSGSSCDAMVYEEGTQVIVLDWDHEYPTWAAGYGKDANTWAMSDYYIQIEVAQGTVHELFTDAAIDSLAQWTAELARRYNFPITRLEYVSQTGTAQRGITTHDGCANGQVYGKTDPGPMFPWTHFLTLAQVYYDGGNTVADVTREEFDALKAAFEEWKAVTDQRYNDDHGWIEENHRYIHGDHRPRIERLERLAQQVDSLEFRPVIE